MQRFWVFRSIAFNFANTFPIGFGSGLCCGKYRSLARSANFCDLTTCKSTGSIPLGGVTPFPCSPVQVLMAASGVKHVWTTGADVPIISQ